MPNAKKLEINILLFFDPPVLANHIVEQRFSTANYYYNGTPEFLRPPAENYKTKADRASIDHQAMVKPAHSNPRSSPVFTST